MVLPCDVPGCSDLTSIFAPWQGTQARAAAASAVAPDDQGRRHDACRGLATGAISALLRSPTAALHASSCIKQETPRARMISPTSATRSRSPTACWRTKACSMPSAMSACAIPTDPGRYLLSRSRSPGVIEADDILEYTLDSEPVTPPIGRALCRAGDPRLHLSGAAGRDGGVPPPRAGGHAVLHRRRADRAGLPPRRRRRRDRAVLEPARRVRRHQSAGGQAGGGPLARSRARAPRGGADEQSRRDRGRGATCASSSRARSSCARTPSISCSAQLLGKVATLTAGETRLAGTHQRAAQRDQPDLGILDPAPRQGRRAAGARRGEIIQGAAARRIGQGHPFAYNDTASSKEPEEPERENTMNPHTARPGDACPARAARPDRRTGVRRRISSRSPSVRSTTGRTRRRRSARTPASSRSTTWCSRMSAPRVPARPCSR